MKLKYLHYEQHYFVKKSKNQCILQEFLEKKKQRVPICETPVSDIHLFYISVLLDDAFVKCVYLQMYVLN